MKTTDLLFSSALVIGMFAAKATAQSGSGQGIEFLPAERQAPVGKAISDAEIKAQRKQAHFGGFAAPEDQRKGYELADYSDFLVVDGKYVILPKNSIIHLPDAHKGLLRSAPEGTLMSWSEFLNQYTGMVTTMDVSLDEVSGDKALNAEKMEIAAKAGLIVIAVYDRSPITVLRAKAQ
ncbi:hypothetical protein ACFSSA_03630 [Luteolibacter algae]|uniref:Uncharacterized protein n=1 Tax=Luteolibacter algae TaxID=454151 RepID=A0ABW5D3W1_9BACT